MNKSMVSVVIPTYKRPDKIARAINSVLAQTYPNIEVIVVDDNDPSYPERKSTELVMSHYSGYANVTYIKHDKNRNGSAARNTGWKVAKGDYITYLDDDDEIAPSKIQKQVECLESLDETWGACYTAYHILMPNGRTLHSKTNRSGDLYLQALMRTFYVGSGSNVLLRKRVVDEIGGYDESFRRNQDIEFMARAFENYKVAYVPIDLLTIHNDERGPHLTNSSFVNDDKISEFYLDKFKTRIENLRLDDAHKVYSVIALERARFAVCSKDYKSAFALLKQYNVSLIEVLKYFTYVVKRYFTRTSYGFYL